MGFDKLSIARIIGNKIIEMRDSKGMTQKQFSVFSGVKLETLQSAEQVKRGSLPSAETIYKIAKACDVSIDWLFGREDKLSDKASDVIVALNDIFSFSIDFNLEDYTSKILKDHLYINLSIDEHLLDFLTKLEKAKILETESKKAAEHLINTAKNKYNAVLAEDIKGDKIEFTLIETNMSFEKFLKKANNSTVYDT